jgi:cytochrome c-type biogenesis protein CcmF
VINNFGYMCLASALAVSLYGVVIPHLGVRRNNWNLVRSAQFAAILNFLLVLAASSVLVRAFLTNDFSVRFVWETSSRDLPVLYKIAAFWGGMDGSLLFWELVLSIFSAIVAYGYQRTNREIIPYVLATLSVIHVFLLLLLVSYSNPLAPLSPVPADGRGLNPLLQHYAMAMHPPLLYLGYVGFSIPFAFAMASLIRGKLDNAWVVTTRRWTLFAWYALAIGQMLGGQWAYEELGWGGYWGWDPVENAAMMPWLTGTAFLHSVILQEKRNMMKVWNVTLIIVTFSLSVLGTFIVRSGVLNSVHAFAQSEIGPAFLAFLAVMLTLAFGLMFWRINLLESRHTSDTLVSKESTFLLNNLLFVGIAFTVFLGTVFPLLAEALRGTKLSIQAPFFNTITAPLGVALLVLLGVCTMIAWRHSSAAYLARNFIAPLAAAGAGVGLLAAFGLREAGALAVFGCAIFTGAVLLLDLWRSIRARSRQESTGYLPALISTVSRNQQRWGGWVIHFGMVLLMVGLAGNYFKEEHTITMTPGRAVTVGGYQLLFKGMRTEQVGNARLQGAEIEVYAGNRLVDVLKPARSYYSTQPDPLTEVAIHRTVKEDLYLVLAGENPGGTITLRVNINPLVMVAWFAFPFFTIGTAICMWYRPRRIFEPAIDNRWSVA